ncbi:NADP-dependent 3-hydroxy acid dehydrogenase YdfG [Paenibacillus taihuensis]|uniref:NADP-dependent 3-hydroxy acid dehydrogenase YdfG n=1 Tax=Paenibacillus taihuensis TaxID=1156355 RepID=A0A3D9Q8M3_9BACL|nr:SDR family oxidoreductase [Paenibacillus taihuensis]REE56297.1 NADP-dependent 3-hydroxy acid dehydrogenase YdfG [Paenibacillus taihuensis]
MSQTIAITGASTGIGLATAQLFAAKGWTVFAGTRNLEREQAAYSEVADLHWLEMEVTDPASLERAFAAIAEKTGGKLDVLFCNAGYGYLRALGQAPMNEIEDVFDTNVYGVINTIKAGLPLLREAGKGHLLATSSVGGLVGQPFNEIYCASKFAVEGLFESLATYYKPLFNIDVTLIEPGAIATNFVQAVYKNINATGGMLDDEYKPLIDAYVSNFTKRASVPQTAESVAEVVLDVVQREEKPLRIRTSEAAEAFSAHKTVNDPTGNAGVLGVRKLHLGL